MRSRSTVTVAAVVTLWAATAGAQPPRSAELEQIKQRQRLSLMEGVLERAVANGADNLLRQVKNVMPEVSSASTTIERILKTVKARPSSPMRSWR